MDRLRAWYEDPALNYPGLNGWKAGSLEGERLVVVPCHKELRHRRNDGHVIRRRGMDPQRRWRWSCHTEERHGPAKKMEDRGYVIKG